MHQKSSVGGGQSFPSSSDVTNQRKTKVRRDGVYSSVVEHLTANRVSSSSGNNESRFNLSSDDNRVRVWRPRGERLNLAFALQRLTAPTAGVMVWGAIAYNTRSPLVLIRGTMTAQRYVPDFLHPHVLLFMQRCSTRQCSASHGKGVTILSAHCYYPSFACRSPDLSPIKHIWDHLGW
ncbi:transposable element Tcb1 transposase [Trichonephila clavipes]|nr:transposable element Tcb1 transposase [Trichonephila clavipes]